MRRLMQYKLQKIALRTFKITVGLFEVPHDVSSKNIKGTFTLQVTEFIY